MARFRLSDIESTSKEKAEIQEVIRELTKEHSKPTFAKVWALWFCATKGIGIGPALDKAFGVKMWGAIEFLFHAFNDPQNTPKVINNFAIRMDGIEAVVTLNSGDTIGWHDLTIKMPMPTEHDWLVVTGWDLQGLSQGFISDEE